MTHPIALGDLLAYWLDELPSPEVDALEEHVFSCASCAQRLHSVQQTGAQLVELIRGGMLASRGTIALLNRCSRDRLNVRRYMVYPGQVVACTVSVDDDFLLAQLLLDRPAPERVDLSVRNERGEELTQLQDVLVDRRGNQVLSLLPARPVQDDPSGRLEYALYAVEQGRRELIGRYTLEHTAMRDA